MSKRTENQSKVTAKNNGSELVKFIFKNYQLEGGDVRFFYGDHETPAQSYHFFDGEQYEAPYSVAEHLAFNTSYPIHHYMVDENNRHVSSVGKRVSRYGIVPLNFIFKKSERPSLVTVETVRQSNLQISL